MFTGTAIVMEKLTAPLSCLPKQATRNRPRSLITHRNLVNIFAIVGLLAHANVAPTPPINAKEAATNGQHAPALAAENGLHKAANQEKGYEGPKVDKKLRFPGGEPTWSLGGEHGYPPIPVTSKKKNYEAGKADKSRVGNDGLKVAEQYKKIDLRFLQEQGFAEKFVEVHGLKIADLDEKDQVLAAVAEQRKALKSRETTLAGFHWYSFKFDKSLSTVLGDYKEAILSEIKKHREKFEKWSSDLSRTNGKSTTQRVRDLWNDFWESVEIEHKRREGGVYYFFVNMLKMIFQRAKWRRERLNSHFLKIRSMTDMSPAIKERILEFERMHQAGVSLTKQERDLIKKIANKGAGGITDEGSSLIPMLTGRVIDSLRVAEVDQLTARLSAWGGGGVKDIDLVVQALGTLKEYALHRQEWTAAQRDLVVSLGEIKTLRRLKSLAKDSKYRPTLHNLAIANLKRVYQNALRSLELEDGLTAAMKTAPEGFKDKLQKMKQAISNEKDEISIKFTEGEWVRIKHLSDEQERRQDKLRLYVDFKTPDPADISLDASLKTTNQRTQEVLERMPNKSQEQFRLLQALQNRPAARLNSDEEKEVNELAHRLVEHTTKKDDRAKALAFLEFLQRDFVKEVGGGEHVIDQTERKLQEETLSPEMSSMTRDYADYYDDFIDAMTAQEKALFHLKMHAKEDKNTQSKLGSLTLPRKELMKKLMDSGVLQENDIAQVVRFAQLRSVPTVPKRALERLQARKLFPLRLSAEEKHLLESLGMRKYRNLSPEENRYIENLARESVLIEKSQAPVELQQTAMKMTTQVQLGDLQAQLSLFQNLKLEELVELARLNNLPSNDNEFQSETKVFKILKILLKADDRRAVDLSLTSLKNLPTIFKQMKEIQTSEIKQANLAVNEKQADYLAFIQLLQARTAGTIDVPGGGLGPVTAVYSKFVKKQGLVEPKPASPAPSPEPQEGPQHTEPVVESNLQSGSKS